ncbi:hypothetical protein [Nocardia abscessus]|uniref:hypothetical protein n=1 Tax=Nocardia abscessus TaxID=120957 RepID=UPI00245736F7|nr:hypothetical protein [Nocardia abscessus]
MTGPQYPTADRYTYRVLREHDAFVARCAEFPALSWSAPTPEEAHAGLAKLVDNTLRDLINSGGDVPQPEVPFTPPPVQHHAPAYPTAPYPMMQPQPYFAPAPPQMMQNVVVNASARAGGYRVGPNHGFHALMTLLTCGMWLPIWIIVWIVGRR